jgi:hypothetical protein
MDVSIPSRFRGPPESGNGGYSAGLLARFVDPRAAEVTLRLPPPLDRPLRVEVSGDGTATLRDGESLVAEGRPIEGLELELPAPVSLERAAAARRASPLHQEHPFPGCFVCGPRRAAGDGMRITPGRVGEGLVGSPWEVGDSLPTEDGELAPEIVWAALDCPGGISAILDPAFGGTWVLGRLAVEISAPVRPGDTCLALGWGLGREGRKYEAGSAIYAEDGRPLARARATWIELRG